MTKILFLFSFLITTSLFSQYKEFDDIEIKKLLLADSINEQIEKHDFAKLNFKSIKEYEVFIGASHEITEFLILNSIDELNYKLFDFYVEQCIKFQEFNTYFFNGLFYLTNNNDWDGSFFDIVYSSTKYDRYNNKNISTLIMTTERRDLLEEVIKIGYERKLYFRPSMPVLHVVAENIDMVYAEKFIKKCPEEYNTLDASFLDFFASFMITGNLIHKDSFTEKQKINLWKIERVIQLKYPPSTINVFRSYNFLKLENNPVVLECT